MQKVLIAFIVILALGSGAFFYFNYFRHKTSTPATTGNPTIELTNNGITHFGALVRAFGIDKPGAVYSRGHLISQLDLLKTLGATDSRANIEVDPQINDDFVNLSVARKLEPTLVVEPLRFFEDQTESSVYKIAKDLATRYKGKVHYYQLANEASGVAIKQGFPGNKATDYDETKYAHLLGLLKGLSTGIHDGDPSAKRIISANWLGTGVIDRLIQDGVNFEIVGWDWYSGMGNDMVKKMDDGTSLDIPDHVRTINKKELWVVETNRDAGTLDDNTADQANFLKTFIPNIQAHKTVSGMFVFTLTDQCDSLTTGTGRMGLVSLTKAIDATCTIDKNKPAFATVQQLFKQYAK